MSNDRRRHPLQPHNVPVELYHKKRPGRYLLNVRFASVWLHHSVTALGCARLCLTGKSPLAVSESSAFARGPTDRVQYVRHSILSKDVRSKFCVAKLIDK